MCCNITPMYFPHFSADKKICGCCVNLGKPIIGSNRWPSLQKIVNYNVAQRNVLSKKFGSYHGIFVWTIDDPQQMEWLISSGIDGIITNQPNKLVQLVRNQTHIRRPRFNLNWFTISLWITLQIDIKLKLILENLLIWVSCWNINSPKMFGPFADFST